ncbi:Disease resistance protein L6 [Linum grandiflorum]
MLKKLSLVMVNVTKEEDLEGIGTLEELVDLMLVLDYTCSLERMASLSKLRKLRTLKAKVPSLRGIEGLAELKSVELLDLEDCVSLERLWPDDHQQLCSLEKLEKLDVRNCISLSAQHLAAVKTSLPPNVKITWPE